MDKVVATAAEAVADIGSRATVVVGGFGVCGIPSALIEATLDAGIRDLEVLSSNCGVEAEIRAKTEPELTVPEPVRVPVAAATTGGS